MDSRCRGLDSDRAHGAFSRRVWFRYDTFVGRTVNIEGAKNGNYVEALDPTRHVVGDRRNSARHRVIDSLLGESGLRPTIRGTATIERQIGLHLDEEARALIENYDPVILGRAVNYL